MTLRIKIDYSLQRPYAAIRKTTFNRITKLKEWGMKLEADCVLVGDVSHAKYCMRLLGKDATEADVLYVSEDVKRRWYPDKDKIRR